MKREIHTERKIFHPLIHSPNRHIKQGWVKPKPGAQNSIHVSHADGRGPSTSVFHYFPRRFSRECIRSGAARAQTSPLIQDSGAASDGLIHWATLWAPVPLFWSPSIHRFWWKGSSTLNCPRWWNTWHLYRTDRTESSVSVTCTHGLGEGDTVHYTGPQRSCPRE